MKSGSLSISYGHSIAKSGLDRSLPVPERRDLEKPHEPEKHETERRESEIRLPEMNEEVKLQEVIKDGMLKIDEVNNNKAEEGKALEVVKEEESKAEADSPKIASLAKSEGATSSESCKKRSKKFTKEEDEKLKNLVKIYGEGCWSFIAGKMDGRNRKQVRERYINFIKKERTTDEFTPEEDAIVMNYVRQEGRKWSSLSEMLPGRTPIMVKNRYYAKLRKILKAGNVESAESLHGSQADATTGEVGTPLIGYERKAPSVGLESVKTAGTVIEGIETLREQEKILKGALAEVKGKIRKIKTDASSVIERVKA